MDRSLWSRIRWGSVGRAAAMLGAAALVAAWPRLAASPVPVVPAATLEQVVPRPAGTPPSRRPPSARRGSGRRSRAAQVAEFGFERRRRHPRHKRRGANPSLPSGSVPAAPPAPAAPAPPTPPEAEFGIG